MLPSGDQVSRGHPGFFGVFFRVFPDAPFRGPSSTFILGSRLARSSFMSSYFGLPARLVHSMGSFWWS